MTELQDIIKPGNTVRIFYGQEHKKTELLHIRAIVDDGMVVVRVWSQRNRNWRYRVEDIGYFEMVHDDGRLKLEKKGDVSDAS